MDKIEKHPFIYGAQYYRAPTPDQIYWEEDLKRMSEAGFTDVKFWAQWRWNNRSENSYNFEDLDKLMDIANKNNLRVTINVITDVCPPWVYNTYPDSKMVTNSGQTLEPSEVICRQIGGYPGPCYNHKEAFSIRIDFIKALVARYANHPAMFMWDMWNEPESSLKLRDPKLETLLCYCDNCKKEFISWLENKYKDIDTLNSIWGRCYISFNEVEMPRTGETFADMIDWRLFALDTLAKEAKARVLAAKEIDKTHAVYLHPVPNTLDCFNSVTGVDDYLMSEHCDCFAGTTNGFPAGPLQTISSAKGKVCYNVESHLRYGSVSMYPKELSIKDFTNAFVPQIGLGIKGFMHWQFRTETLGSESPAWGLINIDGSIGKTFEGATQFWQKLKPYANNILKAKVNAPQVAIFKSTSNDILNFCMYGDLKELIDNVNGYTKVLYGKSVDITYVNEKSIIDELDENIKILILPYTYGLDNKTGDAIANWVENGGLLVCDAHTGAYNISTGRVGYSVPGAGLSKRLGIKEVNATSVCHLGIESDNEEFAGVLGSDVIKAMRAFGTSGGFILPITTKDNIKLFGFTRYAELEGEDIIPIASLPNKKPCIASKNVGCGKVYYFGSLFASTYEKGFNPNFSLIIDKILSDVGISSSIPEGVRFDILKGEDKIFYAFTNLTNENIEFTYDFNKEVKAIFTEVKATNKITLLPKQGEIYC